MSARPSLPRSPSTGSSKKTPRPPSADSKPNSAFGFRPGSAARSASPAESYAMNYTTPHRFSMPTPPPYVSPMKYCALPRGRADDMCSSDDEDDTTRAILDQISLYPSPSRSARNAEEKQQQQPDEEEYPQQDLEATSSPRPKAKSNLFALINDVQSLNVNTMSAAANRLSSVSASGTAAAALLSTSRSQLQSTKSNTERTKTKLRRAALARRRQSRTLASQSYDLVLKTHYGTACPGLGCGICSRDLPVATTTKPDTIDNIIMAIRCQLPKHPKEALVTLRGVVRRVDFDITDDDARDFSVRLVDSIRSPDPILSLCAFHVLYDLCTHPTPAAETFTMALSEYCLEITPKRVLRRDVNTLGFGWVSADEDEDTAMHRNGLSTIGNLHHGVVSFMNAHPTTFSTAAPEDSAERAACKDVTENHFDNFWTLATTAFALDVTIRARGLEHVNYKQIHELVAHSDENGSIDVETGLRLIGFDETRYAAASRRAVDRTLYHPYVFTLDALSDDARGDITEADFLQIEEDFRAIAGKDGVIDIFEASKAGVKIGIGNICSLNLLHGLAMKTRAVSLLQLLIARYPDIAVHYLERRVNHEPVVDDPDLVTKIATSNSVTVKHGSLFNSIDQKIRQLQRSKGRFVLNHEVVTLLKRWFDLYDVDRTAEISYRELEMQGSTIGEMQVDVKMFRKMDKNRSGGISFFELCRSIFPNATTTQIRPIVDTVLSKSSADWEERLRRKAQMEQDYLVARHDEILAMRVQKLQSFGVERAAVASGLETPSAIPPHPLWQQFMDLMGKGDVKTIKLDSCLAVLYPFLTSRDLEAFRLMLPREVDSQQQKCCRCWCCGGGLCAFGMYYPDDDTTYPALSHNAKHLLTRLAEFEADGCVPTERLMFHLPDVDWGDREEVPLVEAMLRGLPNGDDKFVSVQYHVAKCLHFQSPLGVLVDVMRSIQSIAGPDPSGKKRNVVTPETIEAIKEAMRVSVAVRRQTTRHRGALGTGYVAGLWVTQGVDTKRSLATKPSSRRRPSKTSAPNQLEEKNVEAVDEEVTAGSGGEHSPVQSDRRRSSARPSVGFQDAQFSTDRDEIALVLLDPVRRNATVEDADASSSSKPRTARRPTQLLLDTLTSDAVSFVDLAARYQFMPCFALFDLLLFHMNFHHRMHFLMLLDAFCPVLPPCLQKAEVSPVRTTVEKDIEHRVKAERVTMQESPFCLDRYTQRATQRWAVIKILELLEAHGCETSFIVDPRLQFLYRGGKPRLAADVDTSLHTSFEEVADDTHSNYATSVATIARDDIISSTKSKLAGLAPLRHKARVELSDDLVVEDIYSDLLSDPALRERHVRCIWLQTNALLSKDCLFVFKLRLRPQHKKTATTHSITTRALTFVKGRKFMLVSHDVHAEAPCGMVLNNMVSVGVITDRSSGVPVKHLALKVTFPREGPGRGVNTEPVKAKDVEFVKAWMRSSVPCEFTAARIELYPPTPTPHIKYEMSMNHHCIMNN
eukprot:PhM_4_TR11620/c0_g1_i1/m.57223